MHKQYDKYFRAMILCLRTEAEPSIGATLALT